MTFVLQLIFSQTLDSAYNYYPLQVGNTWLYDVTSNGVHKYYSLRTVVGDTSISTGEVYYICQDMNIPGSMSATRYLRVDTVTSIIHYLIYSQDQNQYIDYTSDSLNSNVGDYYGERKCTNVSIDTIFGLPITVKEFGSTSYAYGLGVIAYTFVDYHDLYFADLIYANVSNKEYGTPLSVTNAIILPENISLSQNYPNPFNPCTTINYSLDKDEYIDFIVYDLMGKEVEHLLSENKKVGEYSIKFNGTKLSSGTYFYVLKTGQHRFIRSMLLLK
jgi:hypothetical protein